MSDVLEQKMNEANLTEEEIQKMREQLLEDNIKKLKRGETPDDLNLESLGEILFKIWEKEKKNSTRAAYRKGSFGYRNGSGTPLEKRGKKNSKVKKLQKKARRNNR